MFPSTTQRWDLFFSRKAAWAVNTHIWKFLEPGIEDISKSKIVKISKSKIQLWKIAAWNWVARWCYMLRPCASSVVRAASLAWKNRPRCIEGVLGHAGFPLCFQWHYYNLKINRREERCFVQLWISITVQSLWHYCILLQKCCKTVSCNLYCTGVTAIL